MNPNEYQNATSETEIYSKAARDFLTEIIESETDSPLYGRYPTQQDAIEDAVQILSLMYCAGKLSGEAGEVDEIIFKGFRGGGLHPDAKDKLFKELGDVIWYVTQLATRLGFNLEDIMQANLNKIADRKERGVLHGYGSDR